MKRFEKTNWQEVYTMMHSGDPKLVEKAKEIACQSMKGLIISMSCKKYSGFRAEYNDLITSGYIAVLRALPKYDPEKGKASTFFYPYIEHEMLKWMNDNVNGFSIHYQTMLNRMINTIMDNPHMSNEEVARICDMPVKTVEETRKNYNFSQKISLDDEVKLKGYEKRVLGPEEEFLEKEKSEMLYKFISLSLGSREREIIYDFFGLDGREPLSVSAISELRKIPKKEVEGAKNSALKKLYESGLKAAIDGDDFKMFKDDSIELDIFDEVEEDVYV